MKVAYKKEKTRKQWESEDEDSEIEVLPVKGRGRPKLLGEKLDKIVKKYVWSIQKHGDAVNSVMVLAGARGIVKYLERMQLREYGGHVELTTSWAKSLLKQMNFTKWKATTKLGMSTKAFEEVKKIFYKVWLMWWQWKTSHQSSFLTGTRLVFTWCQLHLGQWRKRDPNVSKWKA